MFLLSGGEAAATFLGYDLPRLHAMLNDFPAALLITAVVFEVLAITTKRDTLRAAAFWTLIAGVLGAGVAVISGLLAEDAIEHGSAIHEIMERHEKFALITLGIFGVLALWHLLRAKKMSSGERVAALVLMLGGAVALVNTGKLGGSMVFEHAAGIPTEKMESEIKNRELGHQHEEGEEDPGGDSVWVDDTVVSKTDTTATQPGHTHAPGTPPHED